MVIVLLKAVLKNVTDLVTTVGGRNGPQTSFQDPNGMSQVPMYENGNGHPTDSSASTAEQVDNARTQEITGKALSAVLILLLKWFKVSRTLYNELW